jgi:hypothetical protein
MKSVKTPQSRCRASVGRCDITPPVGIYHRMWGAALHDRATGVHRPLLATLLVIEPLNEEYGSTQIIVSLDHCILDGQEMRSIRHSISAATSIEYNNIKITLTHTHGSGWMSRTRSHLPGGELIGPYLEELAQKLTRLAQETQLHLREVTMVYGAGVCRMAAHRDYYDETTGRFVCGFNPTGPADDTLLVANLVDESGNTLATVVNYACHPTTLSWDNTWISPDWVGAMRETVEQFTNGLCLFVQGASGDLGPKEGFVGDISVADRNGRQVGFEVLATLEGLPRPGTEYRYAGAVTSGTSIGTWKHTSLDEESLNEQSWWQWKHCTVDLPYRHDLPTVELTKTEREHWLAEESIARNASDEQRVRDCRAQVEQRTRQLTRLEALEPGSTYPLHVDLGILGEAIWVFVPGELYQVFQTTLRERFAPRPVVVSTLTNDWQPGYIPPANSYGYGIYQEVIAATAQGSLETLIDAISSQINAMIDERSRTRHRRDDSNTSLLNSRGQS